MEPNVFLGYPARGIIDVLNNFFAMNNTLPIV
jgi:hypothetical protein